MPLPTESMLGPYRITGVLGEGGMGAVYRATDTRLHRDVAIKVLTAVTMSDHERISRFEQEARTIGMLNHPNLLTIFDVGNAGGTPFLVSELLDGEELRRRLNGGPIPVRKAIDFAQQITEGLAAAHEKGVVHRDLKPENIFLCRDGRVKILDFGIAKLTGSMAGADGPTFQMTATEPGMVLGTVGYMSPEQVRGEQVDHRSDIFSFGTIFYEMLTGNRAFNRSSSIETLSAILKEDPPEVTEILPNLPSAVERLLRRCLEKDRALRFQSARDLAFNFETLSLAPASTLSSTSNPFTSQESASAAGAGHPGTSNFHAPAVRTPPPTMARESSPSPTVRTPVRPHTVARPMPRRVSPVLLTLLFVVAVAGAAIGGWYTAQYFREKPSEVLFHRMTFRRGEIRGARFGTDGDTIVYSAAWEGNPTEIYVANRRTPEARPLGVADADVLAVSRSTELAVLLHRDRLTGRGTLARVPLAGGLPREVAEDVVQAEWSPDGQTLAIIHAVAGKYRIEYPIGTVRYETAHTIHDIRLSPDGSRIAFIEPEGGKNDLAVLPINARAPETIARGWEHGATGLAWTPDGKEIWITGTATAAPPSLHAVRIETGEMRLVNRLTGSMKLYDISPAGRVLLSNGMWRAALEYQPPTQTPQRDASWLDWSVLADLSQDGRTVLFNETREGGGAKSAIYLRSPASPTPIRIGDGYGDALSPDGRWVLCHDGPKLVLLPTGAGEARELKIDGAYDLGGVWLPDSRRVVVGGAQKDKAYRLHLIDTLDETDTAITPENIWGEAFRPFAVSPDGRSVAGMTGQQTIALYPTDGSGQATPLAGTLEGEIPLQWSSDGAALYVYRPTALPVQVFRIALATGGRELWKEFAPADPSGVYKIASICMTRDATAYAYNAFRSLSDLYVAEGLR
jgi:serine/threonine protein kinase